MPPHPQIQPPLQVVPEDHHSNPTNSCCGSIENPNSRPSLNIRQCSLEQPFSPLNPGRASIDNGPMIRSALGQTGYRVESIAQASVVPKAPNSGKAVAF